MVAFINLKLIELLVRIVKVLDLTLKSNKNNVTKSHEIQAFFLFFVGSMILGLYFGNNKLEGNVGAAKSGDRKTYVEDS